MCIYSTVQYQSSFKQCDSKTHKCDDLKKIINCFIGTRMCFSITSALDNIFDYCIRTCVTLNRYRPALHKKHRDLVMMTSLGLK